MYELHVTAAGWLIGAGHDPQVEPAVESDREFLRRDRGESGGNRACIGTSSLAVRVPAYHRAYPSVASNSPHHKDVAQLPSIRQPNPGLLCEIKDSARGDGHADWRLDPSLCGRPAISGISSYPGASDHPEASTG